MAVVRSTLIQFQCLLQGWCEFSFRRNFFRIIENKWDIKDIQILPGAIREGLHHNAFITKKFTHYETSRTLKLDIFKMLDNKNIGKLFLKYKLLFWDQANSSSNQSWILILQVPIRRTSLPLSPSLSNFTIAN